MRTTKKLLSLLLALCMVVSLLPATALAASATECPGGESCTHEAAIGTTHYDTLKEAMGSVQTGQTITLLKDVTLQKGVKTEKKASGVTLDLNGHSIDGTAVTSADGVICMKPGYGWKPVVGVDPVMKIMNSVPGKGGEIMGKLPVQFGTGDSRYTVPGEIGKDVKLIVTEDGIDAVKLSSSAYLVYSETSKDYIKNGGFKITAADGTERIYGSYVSAVKEANDGTVAMLHNYTGTEPIISGSKNGTLDLCGNTYTHTGGNDCIIQVNNNNVSLTVKNGIILSQKLGTDGVQMLGYKSMDTYVPARNRAVTLENVNLTVVGDAYGIITNGQDENERVVLKNSTLNVLDGYGIYFPSSGSVTIEDSVINAKYFGVQMCSGSLEVMGDKTAITTTGEPQKKTESDGPIADGAAISVVNRSYPGGTPTMNVTGGTFNSNHANAVKAYTFSNDNKTEENWENAKEFVSISGGKFSNPESIKDYLEPGCELEGGIVVPAKDSVAKIGNKGYMTLAEAVADAAVGDTITLLADITELSKLTNGATTGNNISLLSIDKDVTIAGNNKTISITMPKEATNRSQAIEIGKNAQVTLDGVTLNVKGSASETDRGDAIDVYGTLNITNKSAITIENVNNGFVMQGGEVAHVNVTGGSTVTIKNVAGNASNGGNFAVKENSVVNISGCQSNGLSVYTLTVDNSDVNISDTGLTAIYGNELKFNAGANVTVERAGTKIPATGWNGVQFNAPVQVKDGKGAQVSMSVASGATVTVKDCVGSDNKSHNTIYLPANTTYTDNGTVNAEIVTAKAPENSFVVTLVSDGKTVGVQTVAKGTAFALPKAPEKSNYTFNGWSDGSKTYKAGEKATIDKDTTFTAQWSYNGYTGPSGYAVKTEVGAHGKLTVSSSYATKGTTVTMTVDRKSTRLNSSHSGESRMPSSA